VGFRDEGVLKQVCKMIGNLKRWTRGLGGGGGGPDRVKIKCREPGAINCSIEFFFGDVGFFITFEGEDCVREDEEDPDDPKTGKAGKRDKDEEDKDGDKKVSLRIVT
jgi:hypothetical protein